MRVMRTSILVAVVLFVLQWTTTAMGQCTASHFFCNDTDRGGIQTNRPEVILSLVANQNALTLSGPLYVAPGHHLILDGSLREGTVHLKGDFILAGGAKLSLYDVVFFVQGSVELRDDSDMTMTLVSYIGYGDCVTIGKDVNLFVEAGLNDPRLNAPIIVLRQNINLDANLTNCVTGTFRSVNAGDLSDQSGQAQQVSGSSCGTRAGALSSIFGSTTCPPPPPSPPPPPPPSTPNVTNSSPPPTDNNDNVAPGSSPPPLEDNAITGYIILGSICSIAVLAIVLLLFSHYNPTLRKMIRPYSDIPYHNENSLTDGNVDDASMDNEEL